MAMRLIKKGVVPDLVYRGTCFRCKSEVEVDRSDLKIEHDQREGKTFAHVVCPVCGGDLVVYPYNKGGQSEGDRRLESKGWSGWPG